MKTAVSKKKKEEDLSMMFSFDRLNILSVIDNDVYIKGNLYNHANDIEMEVGVSYPLGDFKDGDLGECVLIIPRKLFKDLLDQWLDHKKIYWDNWKHFCGVGYVGVDKFIEKQKINVLAEDQSDFDKAFDIDESKAELKYIDVRSFKVLKGFVDMEHG